VALSTGMDPRLYRQAHRVVRKPVISTQDIAIPAYHLNMAGTAQAQAAYTRELFEIAKRDLHYAFVVWFLAIDYDKLYARMPAGSDA